MFIYIYTPGFINFTPEYMTKINTYMFTKRQASECPWSQYL